MVQGAGVLLHQESTDTARTEPQGVRVPKGRAGLAPHSLRCFRIQQGWSSGGQTFQRAGGVREVGESRDLGGLGGAGGGHLMALSA